ncbi:oncoprotein-induced transcript 3 protein-like isoform X2 [Argopecten irradians]|uniref:oncoprotein-induced transcript 3 protein-like isoform X2 n=1 Tax=Argopecten irradians TaxID=31199 RepID=UPI00371286E5
MVKFGVVYVFTLLSCSISDGDPCQVTNHVTLNGQWRSINNIINPSETANCDSTMSDTWYRVESHILGEIATAPPSEYSCGTRYPIWMGDVFPGPGQTRTVQVCFSTNFNTCESPWTIDVKNCETFYVYQLTRPSKCPSAYCFKSDTDNDDTLLAEIIPSVVVAVIIIIIVAVCILKHKLSSSRVFTVSNERGPGRTSEIIVTRIVDNQQPGNLQPGNQHPGNQHPGNQQPGNRGERGPPPPGYLDGLTR